MYIQKTTLCKEAQSIYYKKREKQKQRKKLITKKKRAKEQRERFTRCESPSLRPIKRELGKRASNWSLDLSKSSKVC